MAYEKALSLISGGGKVFEIEIDAEANTPVIKATPEEMEVGAMAILAQTVNSATAQTGWFILGYDGTSQAVALTYEGAEPAIKKFVYQEYFGGFAPLMG